VPQVADVLLGVAVDEQQVGFLAGLDRAGAVGNLDVARGRDGRGGEGFRRALLRAIAGSTNVLKPLQPDQHFRDLG
jgi:hypothetical protein